MTRATLDDLLDVVSRFDMQAIQWEIRKAAAVREWALEHLDIDYGVGDRVEICESFADRELPRGWYHKREALVPGALATVLAIDFNTHYRRWYVDVILDREWTVTDVGGVVKRHWNGPVAETPEGFEAPSAFDQERHPEGRKHLFSMRPEHLRLAAGASS